MTTVIDGPRSQISGSLAPKPMPPFSFVGGDVIPLDRWAGGKEVGFYEDSLRIFGENQFWNQTTYVLGALDTFGTLDCEREAARPLG